MDIGNEVSVCDFEDKGDVFDEIELSFNMALNSDDDIDNNDNDAGSVSATTEGDSSWVDLMSEEDIVDLEYTVIDMLNDYMETELESMYMATFVENMLKDVAELVCNQLCDAGIQVAEDDTHLEEWINNLYNELRCTNSTLVCRSRETTTPESLDEAHNQSIDAVLELLEHNEGQRYKQRTYEWYEYRAGLITASNLWKIFSKSQSVQNSLIYEKCKPFLMASSHNSNSGKDEGADGGVPSEPHHVNTGTAFHWGNKYEPLSIKIYERKYDTRIAEFGCIRHHKYPFIGASPDGINVRRGSPRYGRMIEVKNIYNREITGIPKDEYWIQMQFQMETCGLDECDFIETRFKEYTSEDEFYSGEFTHDTRGVILYFVERSANSIGNINPHYVYMPLDHSLEQNDVDNWIAQTKEAMRMTHHLYEIQYWYLDEFSCVLVDVNKLWIQSVIPKVESFWQLICKEKISGYEHRSPKKRVTKEETGFGLGTGGGFCLIKLDAEGNAI
jgi:putative phage-type endonuclease